MRLFVCVSLIVFCFATTNFAQKVGKPAVKKPVVVSQFAEAEKEWQSFWQDFKKRVSRRNLIEFKQLVSTRYACWGEIRGDCSEHCNAVQDKRNLFFTCSAFDQKKWCEMLEFLFSKKTRIGEVRKDFGFVHRTVDSDPTPTYKSAMFEFDLSKGKWLLIDFSINGGG